MCLPNGDSEFSAASLMASQRSGDASGLFGRMERSELIRGSSTPVQGPESAFTHRLDRPMRARSSGMSSREELMRSKRGGEGLHGQTGF